MPLHINSFKHYIKTKSTSLRIFNLYNHKLKGKIIAANSNKLKIEFGYYKESKITKIELDKFFKYNRRISFIKKKNQINLLNNKINFLLKE